MQYCYSGKRRSAKSVVKPDHILTLSCFQPAGSCSDLAFTEYISCPSTGYICYWEQADNLEAAGVSFGDSFARDPCTMGSRLLDWYVPLLVSLCLLASKRIWAFLAGFVLSGISYFLNVNHHFSLFYDFLIDDLGTLLLSRLPILLSIVLFLAVGVQMEIARKDW